MFLVGDDNIQADRAFLFRCGAPRLRHKSEIGNKLAASPEIARDFDPGVLWMLVLHARDCMIKQRSRLMEMQLRFAAAGDGKILQDFRLERGSKTFDLADAIFLCRGFEFSQRADADLLIELQYLVRPKARNGKEFQKAFRNLLAQFFKAGCEPVV